MKISDFVETSLERIGRAAVCVKRASALPAVFENRGKECEMQVPSLRADAVCAAALHLSRADSAALFSRGLLFVNARLLTQGARELSPGDVVSARGFGRFELLDLCGETRKGRLKVRLRLFTD